MTSWPHRHFWRCDTTRSTIISGHIGHSRNTNKSLPYQTQPAGFCRDFSRAAASLNHQHERPAGGEWRRIRPLPDPLCARLLPRLACALIRPLFVHFVQAVQAPPTRTERSKKDVSKIVQICAVSCSKCLLCIAKHPIKMQTSITIDFYFQKVEQNGLYKNQNRQPFLL